MPSDAHSPIGSLAHLPPEIRNTIYEYIMPSYTCALALVASDTEDKAWGRNSLAILRTSLLRQRGFAFEFYAPNGTGGFCRFQSRRLRPTPESSITKLRVVMSLLPPNPDAQGFKRVRDAIEDFVRRLRHAPPIEHLTIEVCEKMKPAICHRELLELFDQGNSTCLSDKEVLVPLCSLNRSNAPCYCELNLAVILKLFRPLRGVGAAEINVQKYRDEYLNELLREVADNVKEEIVESIVEGAWKERDMRGAD